MITGTIGGEVWLIKTTTARTVSLIITDSVWSDFDRDGYADGLLDGTESYNPDGYEIISYIWMINDSVLGTVAQITAMLPVGENQVTLTVADINGLSGFATKSISVVLGELPVPVITAESQWKDITGDGFAQGNLDASSSSHPAGFTITGFEWSLNNLVLGTTAQITASLPTGTNRVKLTITDENGLIDSTSKNINVHAQKIQTAGPIMSAVSSIGDSLFFASSADDKVYYYDRTGNLKGTIRTGGAIRSNFQCGHNNKPYHPPNLQRKDYQQYYLLGTLWVQLSVASMRER